MILDLIAYAYVLMFLFSLLYLHICSPFTSKSYAFLVHGRGPAVGDFGFELSTNTTLISSRIVIQNNKINNMKCWTNEVPGKKTDQEYWER